jgi:hypothetical protein
VIATSRGGSSAARFGCDRRVVELDDQLDAISTSEDVENRLGRSRLRGRRILEYQLKETDKEREDFMLDLPFLGLGILLLIASTAVQLVCGRESRPVAVPLVSRIHDARSPRGGQPPFGSYLASWREIDR